MGTKISWCDETINPIVGCSKVSEGCDNCYAETMAAWLSGMGVGQYQRVTHNGKWFGCTEYVAKELHKPLAWKAPRSIFLCSMGDMFHETVSFGHIDMIMATVAMCPQHTFIVLTKRPKQMRDYFVSARGLGYKPLKNLVLGVSVENQQTADARIPVLLQIPAAKRFVSIEPMIGPVNLEQISYPDECRCNWCGGYTGDDGHDCYDLSIPTGIHGVILGSESGKKARYLNPTWVRSIRDQCESAEVPFMFKQWVNPHGSTPCNEKGFPFIDGDTHTGLAWNLKK